MGHTNDYNLIFIMLAIKCPSPLECNVILNPAPQHFHTCPQHFHTFHWLMGHLQALEANEMHHMLNLHGNLHILCNLCIYNTR